MGQASPVDIILTWLHQLPIDAAGDIGPDTELIECGILDSIAILDLVSFLEETFGFALPLDDFVAENFATPAAIAHMAERLGSGATGHEGS